MIPYSMVIEWSEEDRCYLVHLPDFKEFTGPQWYVTHGETYEGAAKHGQEVLETYVEIYQQEGRALPDPVALQPA
jgi:predicted RNase H-like HicB family nuclease